MKALTWHGKGDIRCESVPDPKIEHPRDAIIKVTACAICGSDLHLFDGVIPDDGERRRPRPRDHGRGRRGRLREQEAEGRRPRRRALHDRLRRMLLLQARLLLGLRALQSRTQRWPRSCGAIRRPGCSAIRICSAAIAGGQAEYLRVPYADVGPIKVPDGLTDEQVLFLSDIFPTGYMAAEFCNIQARRHDRDLGLRPGRPVRDPQRLPARRRAGHRDRYGAGAAGARARRPAPRRSIS